MKLILLTLTCLVAYVACETCTSVNDCHLTECTGTGWALHCIDGGCSCTHDDLGGTGCTSNADCAGVTVGGLPLQCNIHIGPIHLVPICSNGSCRCGRQ
ncbi:hypothetical protein DPMN_069431 [Dreissena polymorpha]|uniref:Uncharacterized protein n=1 Tax=Dreissena polymorpha TaxID=45954 RepID=A0A9D3YZ33_DREPO|nr:hypothetical protein DPMN_069431 [Dreissena polymorpha]